jgi:hypothetical protein
MIENEGPRGPFRRKVERKRANWTGPGVEGRIHVLEEPWGRFSFADEAQRQELAAFVNENEIDLLVCGPLVSLGAIGGGTPEEVSAFEDLLAKLRAACTRALALWMVHHENKAGDVSGAFERLPDTLAHVKQAEPRHTALHWRKARWSSRLHDARWTLAWTDGESFELLDQEAKDAARAAQLESDRERVFVYVGEHPGEAKSAIEDALGKPLGRGGRTRIRRAIKAELTASTPRLAKGPGKSPNGTYLYPASEANSPTRRGANGEYWYDPLTETQLANSPPPVGGERYGELADGVDESLEQDEELTWR